MIGDKNKFGGVTEIDVNRLSRDGLVLMGMREALAKWVGELRFQAGAATHPGVARVCGEIADKLAADMDRVAVELTKRAILDKAGSMTELRPTKEH